MIGNKSEPLLVIPIEDLIQASEEAQDSYGSSLVGLSPELRTVIQMHIRIALTGVVTKAISKASYTGNKKAAS